jgi:hypothetical protein
MGKMYRGIGQHRHNSTDINIKKQEQASPPAAGKYQPSATAKTKTKEPSASR